MEFYIEAKLFEDEGGKVWRGRAIHMVSRKEQNFLLPLNPERPLVEAETSTAYELATALPFIVDPAEAVTMLVRAKETKSSVEQLLSDPVVADIISDININVEVY